MSYVVHRSAHHTPEVSIDRVVITADPVAADMLGRYLRSGGVPPEWGPPLLVLGEQLRNTVKEIERQANQ